jgi:acetylglutamate kinase
MIDLRRAAPHVLAQRDRILVVKIGGACLARPRLLQAFAEQMAVVHAFGACPVVVHGGGPQTDALLRQLGEEPRKVDGRRVTSPEALRALRMTVAGELNGELAAALSAAGAPATGLCASSLVTARRRPPVQTSEGTTDFGEVGDVTEVNPEPVLALLEAGVVPVIGPPAGDGRGGFLNVNADSLAAEIAVALGAEKFILLSDVGGILRDPGDAHSLVSTLGLEQLEQLREAGALVGGMSVKARAVTRAIEGGVNKAHLISGLDPEALLVELYTNHGAGTLVTADPVEAAAAATA